MAAKLTILTNDRADFSCSIPLIISMPLKSLGKISFWLHRMTEWEKERKVIWTRAKGSLIALHWRSEESRKKKEINFYLLLNFLDQKGNFEKINKVEWLRSSATNIVRLPVLWLIVIIAWNSSRLATLNMISGDRKNINDPSLYFMVNSLPFCKGLPKIR